MTEGGLGPFRRVTSSGRYIAEVDGLRFLAIASVFLFHLRAYLGIKSSIVWNVPYHHDWLARLTHLGNAGVPLFFVISGFILGLPFASHRLKGAEPVSLRAYFLRRLTRLEPPYLVSLTAFLVLLRVVNGEPWSRLIPGYLASCVYLRNLMGDRVAAINTVAWSLEIEVQFYLLAPLLALVFAVPGRWARRLAIAAPALAAALGQWLWIAPGSVAANSLLNYLQYFLAGFLLADAFLIEFGGQTGRNRGPGGGLLWDLAGLAAAVAALWAWPDPLASRVVAPAAFALLAASAFQGRGVRWALGRPWVAAIGGMCYSIYLIHYQVISLVGRFTRNLPVSRSFWAALLFQAVAVGLPTLALSAAFFLLVEKPCMRKDWPARWWQRLGVIASAPARRNCGRPRR